MLFVFDVFVSGSVLEEATGPNCRLWKLDGREPIMELEGRIGSGHWIIISFAANQPVFFYYNVHSSNPKDLDHHAWRTFLYPSKPSVHNSGDSQRRPEWIGSFRLTEQEKWIGCSFGLALSKLAW